MTPLIRIVEPLGERAAGLPLDCGGEGTELAVPGVDGIAVRISASGRSWQAERIAEAAATVNGLPLREPQLLSDGDVIALGAAHLVVWPADARVDVAHLAGNATVAPLREALLPGDEVVAGVREIFAAATPAAAGRAAALTAGSSTGKGRWVAWGGVAAVLLALGGLLFALVPVPLQLVPDGARVQVEGLFHWQTGDRIFLLPGRRTLQISHTGYRSRSLQLDVSGALRGAAPLPIQLELLPGIIEVDTQGVAAELLADGRPVGTVPGEIELPAGGHDVVLRAPRYLDHVTRLQVEGGGVRQKLVAQLQSSLGFLVLDTDPTGATIRVDGKELGMAPQRLELDAGLHQLALAAPGRRAWHSEVAIIAGQTLELGRINLDLPPAMALRAAVSKVDAPPPSGPGDSAAPVAAPRSAPAARVESALLGTLVLLPAGKYLQGSDRREQGRRSNETQREVQLTRAFYLAATEVSNVQFRAFRAAHVSGIANEKSLDLDAQAVTNVSWNDAVEFCNWLSLRENLPVAYERRDGRWQLVLPLTTGYRLPTEAEWEYAARYVDGQRWPRYAWGENLPPPRGTANLAGEESLPVRPGPESRLATSLPQFRDEHEVVAPVDSYARSPVGLLGMGGNVSEWMHDVYVSLPESGPVTDPMGAATDGAHSIRGANWRTAAIAALRLAWRERASAPSQVIGFRVARYAEEVP